MNRRSIITKLLLAAIIAAVLLYAASSRYPVMYSEYIDAESAEYGINPPLVYALIKAESGFNPGAESRMGAIGLMQLMPGTAAEVAYELGLEYNTETARDAGVNIRLGCKYLGALLNRYGGDATKALAAYNAGYGNVNRWGLPEEDAADSIPFPETKKYVKQVLRDEKVYGIILKLAKNFGGLRGN